MGVPWENVTENCFNITYEQIDFHEIISISFGLWIKSFDWLPSNKRGILIVSFRWYYMEEKHQAVGLRTDFARSACTETSCLVFLCTDEQTVRTVNFDIDIFKIKFKNKLSNCNKTMNMLKYKFLTLTYYLHHIKNLIITLLIITLPNNKTNITVNNSY